MKSEELIYKSVQINMDLSISSLACLVISNQLNSC
jgi:hypothetical protein